MMTYHDLRVTAETMRRIQLRRLDHLLARLERLNLLDVEAVPEELSSELRAAGVGHPTGSSVTLAIDLVFRVQERYLLPAPVITQRRGRSAA